MDLTLLLSVKAFEFEFIWTLSRLKSSFRTQLSPKTSRTDDRYSKPISKQSAPSSFSFRRTLRLANRHSL